MTSASYYQIRVAGTVPPEVVVDFDQLRVSEAPVETMICGALPDQAALLKLLARLETFRAPLLEVHQLWARNRQAAKMHEHAAEFFDEHGEPGKADRERDLVAREVQAQKPPPPRQRRASEDPPSDS